MEVKQRIAQCLEIQRKNNQKIVFAIITMYLLVQVAISFWLVLSVNLIMLNDLLCIVILLVSMILMLAGFFAFHSGFCIILLKLIRNERVILGDMFIPFRAFGKTLRNARFFIISIFLIYNVAAVISLLNQDINNMMTNFNIDKIELPFIIFIYSLFALTLLANLPFVFLPFFAFDMSEKSPKEIKQFSLSLFKTSFKDLFLSWAMFAGKIFALFAALFVLSLFNIKTISSLAAFISSILIFLVYSSIMLMTACVYQDYVYPDSQPEILKIEECQDSHEETEKN